MNRSSTVPPCVSRYWLLRSGESLNDVEGLVATNPVDKLSFKLTPAGRHAAEKASDKLVSYGAVSGGNVDCCHAMSP